MSNDRVKVPIFVESRYKINRKKIKEKVAETIKKNGMVGSVEVSIAVIGDRKMREMNKKYRQLDKTTNVLSFPQVEPHVSDGGVFPQIQTDVLLLGDVVVSYPQVIKEAAEEDMLVDDKINQLVEHGILHLLGKHHE